MSYDPRTKRGILIAFYSHLQKLKKTTGNLPMSYEPRTKRGILIGVSILVGIFFPLLSIVLLVIAGALIAWGREPQRTEEFLNGLPLGQEIKSALAKFDAFIS